MNSPTRMHRRLTYAAWSTTRLRVLASPAADDRAGLKRLMDALFDGPRVDAGEDDLHRS